MGGDSDDLNLSPARLIAGASVAGASHERAGTGCQDRFAFRYLGGGRYALSLADGLGSASRPELGASRAVDAAMTAIDSTQCGDLTSSARSMIDRARAALEETAAAEGIALNELACTLLVFVGEGSSGAVAHIGDGAAVAAVGGKLMLASPPNDSEYTNEVTPLTAAAWQKHVRVSDVLEDVGGVVLFSDGCQRAALRREGGWVPHEGFFLPLLEHLRECEHPETAAADIAALLAGAKIAEHSDDDKTLVAAVPIESWR